MTRLRLDDLERRVLGVLIEKEATTPEQYPLTLNALTSGCNQKSNRDPVLSLSEAEVLITFEGLRSKGLAGTSHQSGGRVERFRHSAREILGVGAIALAVLTELFLRGEQTPGELKTRASRMREITSPAAAEEALHELRAKNYVVARPPAPGSRAARWAQTLAAETSEAPPDPFAPRPVVAPEPVVAPRAAPGSAVATPRPSGDLAARVASLEEEVRRQGRLLTRLSEALGEPVEE